MDNKFLEGGVEWRPQLSPERAARVEAHARRFAAAASLFREVRKAVGKSQVEAARLLGMTQANVSKLERRACADITHIKTLAEAGDFEVSVVLKRDGEVIEFAV